MGKEALKTKEEMQAIARKNAAARIKKVGVSVCAVSCDTLFLLAREREREREREIPRFPLCACINTYVYITFGHAKASQRCSWNLALS